MDNLEQQTEPQTEQQINLIITEEMRSYMYVTSKWAKFIAWVGIVIAGLLFFGTVTLLITVLISFFYTLTADIIPNRFSPVAMIYMPVVSLVFFYLHLMLLKYSTSTQNAVLYGHQDSLNDATKKLKSYFKIMGIITLVSLAFYIIIILFIIVI